LLGVELNGDGEFEGELLPLGEGDPLLLLLLGDTIEGEFLPLGEGEPFALLGTELDGEFLGLGAALEGDPAPLLGNGTGLGGMGMH